MAQCGVDNVRQGGECIAGGGGIGLIGLHRRGGLFREDKPGGRILRECETGTGRRPYAAKTALRHSLLAWRWISKWPQQAQCQRAQSCAVAPRAALVYLNAFSALGTGGGAGAPVVALLSPGQFRLRFSVSQVPSGLLWPGDSGQHPGRLVALSCPRKPGKLCSRVRRPISALCRAIRARRQAAGGAGTSNGLGLQWTRAMRSPSRSQVPFTRQKQSIWRPRARHMVPSLPYMVVPRCV